MRSISVIFHVVFFVHICHCGFLGSNVFQKYNDHCDDLFQSPIDLPADSKIASYGNFEFTGYKYSYNTTLIINNGTPEYKWSGSRQVLVSKGGLKGTYYFHRSKYYTPSLHTVAGGRYIGELHYVCVNTKYPDYETASLYPDGLAILVTFVMIGTKENLVFAQYVEGLKHLTGDPPSHEYLVKVSPAGGISLDTCSFFRYQGKLSPNSCNEIVTWTIFTEPIEMTEKQYMETSNILQTISNKHNLDSENVHTKLRGIDLDDFKYNRKRIVTLQPRIFCKNYFESKEVFPWFLFHKMF